LLPAITNAAQNPDDALLPGPMLVVEDDPLIQARLRDLLIALGYAPEALLFAGSILYCRPGSCQRWRRSKKEGPRKFPPNLLIRREFRGPTLRF